MICCKCGKPIKHSYGRVTDLGNYCYQCAMQNEDEAKKIIVEENRKLVQLTRKDTAEKIWKIVDSKLDLYRNGVIGGSLYDYGYKDAVCEIKFKIKEIFRLQVEE